MIVSDSTCLIHLSKIGRLDLLKQVFERVLIPEAVYNEVVVRGEGKPGSATIASHHWIVKTSLSALQHAETSGLLKAAHIGRGEAEAIVLAKSQKAGLLIDDAVAMRVAKTFGIETYWATSVILKAVSEKTLEKREAKHILEELVRSGYRLQPEILIELLHRLSK